MTIKQNISKEEIEQWNKFLESGKEMPLKPADYFNKIYNPERATGKTTEEVIKNE